MSDQKNRLGAVNTVLGPIEPSALGVTAIHEALLSVVPGAQYAHDISMDRSEIYDAIAPRLERFAAAGGGTVVDNTGMFHGRDLRLLESLSRATGVHIVASTGMGPEENLGGYFLTPQTNPPTPWPAEKFADLLAQEINDGMVVPRLERRAAAGLIVTEADKSGITPTEVSLFQGSARAARTTGVPLSVRWGTDPLAELDVVLGEGVAADRVAVASLDRASASAQAVGVAQRGAFVAIDHVGTNSSSEFITDAQRAALVVELIAAGYLEQILLSSNSTAVAKGHEPNNVPLEFVLESFVPELTKLGVSEADVTRILTANPATFLTVRPQSA
jgi:phosphotriesterase-related protein